MNRLIVIFAIVTAALLCAGSASALPTFTTYYSYYDELGNGIGFERDGCLGYNLIGQTSENYHMTVNGCGEDPGLACDDFGLTNFRSNGDYPWCASEGYIHLFSIGMVTDSDGNYCDPRGYGYSCEQ